MRLYVLPLVASLSALPAAYAWGAAGHEIVATIAQMHLHPQAHAEICSILGYEDDANAEPSCHLASIATWADRVRNRMRWSASLHYVGAKDDNPSQTCAYPGENGWAGRERANVLGATRNVTDILTAYADKGGFASEGPDDRAEEALKFLVHFIGDLHMPLHLTGRLRGGNGAKVRFDGRITNLHSVWDSRLIAKSLRTVPRNYTRPLPHSPDIERALRGTIYDPYVRRIAWEFLSADGTWAPDVPTWLSCPPVRSPGVWGGVQSALGLGVSAGAGGAGEETDDASICPFAWSALIHPLNCELIWPPALDEALAASAASFPSEHEGHEHPPTAEAEFASILAEPVAPASNPRHPGPNYIELDTPEYAGVIEKRLVVERLLAQGGVRLAAVLNWIFVLPEDGRERAMEVPTLV